MDTNELAQLMRAALDEAESPPEFDQAMAKLGVELEWSRRRDEKLVGLKLRPAGTTTWLSASSASRDLSCSKILAILSRNADLRKELRAAAEAAAADAVGFADGRAHQRVSVKLERNAALDAVTAAPGIAARALPPAEADAARTKAAAGPDPLEFLEAPEPAPATLDDASLKVPPANPAAAAQQDANHQNDKDEQDNQGRFEAQIEISEQYKKLSAAQLIELRNAAKRPLDDALVALALLEKLLALALRWLSFGAIKVATNISLALQQRELIAHAADDEIGRRHRSPATAGERIKWLGEYQSALGSRQLKIDAAKTLSDLGKLHAASGTNLLRQQLVAQADAARAKAGAPAPASRQLKHEVKKREIEVAGLLAEAATPLARLRRLSTSADFKKRLARAEELKQRALDQLARFFDAVEEDVQKHQAARDAKAAKENAVLKDEAEVLNIEIRDRVPVLRREIEREEMKERLRGIGDAPVTSTPG